MKFITSDDCIFTGKPFENDLFNNRKKFGDTLTKFIDNVDDGCVLAIDAKWGEGKTTFAKWWIEDLRQKHIPIYFDAFKHDYNSEPFWSFMKTLAAQFQEIENFDEKVGPTFNKLTNEVIPAFLSYAAFTSATLAFSPEITSTVPTLLACGAKTLADSVKNFLTKPAVNKSLEQVMDEFRNILDQITSSLFLKDQKKCYYSGCR